MGTARVEVETGGLVEVTVDGRVGSVVSVAGIGVAVEARVGVVTSAAVVGAVGAGGARVGAFVAAGRLAGESVATRKGVIVVREALGTTMVTNPRTTASMVRFGVGCGMNGAPVWARA